MAVDSSILKILSGTHVGAEVVLSAQELVLGRDESCDLILDDVSLSARHISLCATADGVQITLLDEDKPIYVDGESLSATTTMLQPFQVIMIGTLFMATGPADTPWPTIDLLQANKIDQPATASAEEAQDIGESSVTGATAKNDNEQDDERDNNQNNNQNDQQNNQQRAPDNTDDGQPDTSQADVQATKPRRLPYLLAAGVFLIVLAVFVIEWLLILPDPDHKHLDEEKIDQVQQLVEEFGGKIKFTMPTREDMLPDISGYVDTEISRRQFLTRLRALDVHAQVNITSSEKTMQSISIIIDGFLRDYKSSHVEVVAVANSPGDFVLQGYVQDPAAWDTALQRLRHDVTNVSSLKDETETRQDRIAVLRKMVAEAGIGEQVTLSETAQGVVLAGDLDAAGEAKLRQIEQAFNQQYRAKPQLMLLVEGGGVKNDPGIDLDIRAISFGVDPHIVLKNGERYREGSRLDNGYTIDSIGTESIVLKKGDMTSYFYLNAADD